MTKYKRYHQWPTDGVTKKMLDGAIDRNFGKLTRRLDHYKERLRLLEEAVAQLATQPRKKG